MAMETSNGTLRALPLAAAWRLLPRPAARWLLGYDTWAVGSWWPGPWRRDDGVVLFEGVDQPHVVLLVTPWGLVRAAADRDGRAQLVADARPRDLLLFGIPGWRSSRFLAVHHAHRARILHGVVASPTTPAAPSRHPLSTRIPARRQFDATALSVWTPAADLAGSALVLIRRTGRATGAVGAAKQQAVMRKAQPDDLLISLPASGAMPLRIRIDDLTAAHRALQRDTA